MEGSILANELKKIISLVDMLRDIGLDNLLSLPKIVILGNQSSGKSSLVEQIVGLDFLPRGTGVVTKRPLELRMNNIVNLVNPYAEFDEVIQGQEKRKFTDFNQVRKKIIEVTDNVCKGKNIKDLPIVLNIFSATCPNLTIVDLPGITLIPVQGQPENIHQITRQMAIRYIKEPRSIILCVIPANQDIVNSQALHLMRLIDPNGERSIGCLTKIDIMNRGDDATKMLKNQQVPLKYGYVGVKNRCQYDINHNISVIDSLKAQKQYFATSPIYSRLPSQLVTTESLTKKLTQILYQQIKDSIPQILAQIKNKKLATKKQLKKINPIVFSNSSEIVQYVMKSVSDFINNFNASINGITNSQLYIDPISSRIRNHLYGLYQEQYDKSATSCYSDQQMLQIINNYGSTFLNFYAIDTFTATINPILKKLQAPAHLLNNNIHQLLLSEANSLINKIFNPNSPEFNKKFAGIVKSVLEQNRSELQKFLTSLLQAEINYFFTNDTEYLFQDFCLTKKQKDKVIKIKEGYVIYELRKRVDAYYKLVVRNLRDLIAKQIIHFLMTKSQKQLSLATFKFISDQEKLKQLFKQPEEQSKRRLCLQKELKIYQESQKKISSDPNIVKVMKQERGKIHINKDNTFNPNIERQTKKTQYQHKNMKQDLNKKSNKQQQKSQITHQQQNSNDISRPLYPIAQHITHESARRQRSKKIFNDLFGIRIQQNK